MGVPISVYMHLCMCLLGGIHATCPHVHLPPQQHVQCESQWHSKSSTGYSEQLVVSSLDCSWLRGKNPSHEISDGICTHRRS